MRGREGLEVDQPDRRLHLFCPLCSRCLVFYVTRSAVITCCRCPASLCLTLTGGGGRRKRLTDEVGNTPARPAARCIRGAAQGLGGSPAVRGSASSLRICARRVDDRIYASFWDPWAGVAVEAAAAGVEWSALGCLPARRRWVKNVKTSRKKEARV